MAENLPIIILVRDLLFQSRITAAAKAARQVYVVVRDASKLPDTPGRLLIADLNQEGAIEAAQAWKLAPGRKAIGFVSHVDTERIQAARAAGFDTVLPRSAFVVQLPALLSSSQ